MTEIQKSHTGSCKRRHSFYYERKAKFIHNWPHYCRTCKGLGGSYGMFDPSPPGVSLGSGFMVEFDECPSCIDENVCPRCGQDMGNVDYFGDLKCSKCGWDSELASIDNDGEYCIPPKPGCDCFAEDEYEITREELETGRELETDLANDPEVQARRDDVDNALLFIFGQNDRDEEGG